MVCLNHPDTPAVAKCSACGKPLCADCIVSDGKSPYCSSACCRKGIAAQVRSQATLQEKAGTEARIRRKRFFWALILLILAAIATYCYFNDRYQDNPDSGLYREKIKVDASGLMDKAGQLLPGSGN